MKIGIIYYSQTGHTGNVAKRLQDALTEEGHLVTLEAIKVKQTFAEEQAVPATATILHTPNPNDYDAVIFGSPVQGFSIARVMPSYFASLDSLQDKPIAFFIVHKLPPFLGGNKAAKMMQHLVGGKNGTLMGDFKVRWGSKQQETQIQTGMKTFKDLFL